MRTATTLLGLLVVLTPMPAPAQDLPETAQDLRATAEDLMAPMRDPEAMNYQLSMEKLRKLVEVQRGLNALVASDPKLFEGIDSETEARAKKGGAPLTVAERAAVIDRHPQIRRVFSGAGVTSRDWILTSLAMGNAGLALAIKNGELDPEAAPPPETAAQKANLALLEKNQAEWRKILEELERLGEELDKAGE